MQNLLNNWLGERDLVVRMEPISYIYIYMSSGNATFLVLTASLLTEVCHDVTVEPELQPIDGESMSNTTANSSQGARLDIAVNGFWGGRFE